MSVIFENLVWLNWILLDWKLPFSQERNMQYNWVSKNEVLGFILREPNSSYIFFYIEKKVRYFAGN